MFGALSTGRSGLINTGAALSVIGNNIANVGTTGFKAARVEFADLISAEAGGE
ncbi:MAG: flagellar biosynthesis protein FlgE, partial [Deltaproteobacteria bacterium]